jgi:Fe-S-cluster containining protein
MPTDFSNAVSEASQRPELHSAIHDLYQSLQTQIDLRKPICNASGRCCHFDEFGHRLYITTAEMATFLFDLQIHAAGKDSCEGNDRTLNAERKTLKTPHPIPPPEYKTREVAQASSSSFIVHRSSFELNILPASQIPTSLSCPYQINNLCSVHSIRPFGCRIFFCDPTATDWQHDQYEIFHQQLKLIHSRFSIPYFYMEWRAALAELELGPR